MRAQLGHYDVTNDENLVYHRRSGLFQLGATSISIWSNGNVLIRTGYVIQHPISFTIKDSKVCEERSFSILEKLQRVTIRQADSGMEVTLPVIVGGPSLTDTIQEVVHGKGATSVYVPNQQLNHHPRYAKTGFALFAIVLALLFFGSVKMKQLVFPSNSPRVQITEESALETNVIIEEEENEKKLSLPDHSPVDKTNPGVIETSTDIEEEEEKDHFELKEELAGLYSRVEDGACDIWIQAFPFSEPSNYLIVISMIMLLIVCISMLLPRKGAIMGEIISAAVTVGTAGYELLIHKETNTIKYLPLFIVMYGIIFLMVRIVSDRKHGSFMNRLSALFCLVGSILAVYLYILNPNVFSVDQQPLYPGQALEIVEKLGFDGAINTYIAPVLLLFVTCLIAALCDGYMYGFISSVSLFGSILISALVNDFTTQHIIALSICCAIGIRMLYKHYDE